MTSDLDDIRQRLIGIEEDLAEAALTRLREALESGDAAAPLDERRVTRARRAIEKAIALLDEPRDQLDD